MTTRKKRKQPRCAQCTRFTKKSDLDDNGGICLPCAGDEYHWMVDEGFLPRADGTFRPADLGP
ncbi:MAG TPA: hypothetical protein VD862_00720 [Candidatus Paceibacterota bacterium]|nr:hypothetical protein [Candidatus Paceibacterota bacterium]